MLLLLLPNKAYVNRKEKEVTMENDSDASSAGGGGGGGGAGGGDGGIGGGGGGIGAGCDPAMAAREGTAVRRPSPDLTMVLVITSHSRKMFRKPTQSRWHLVAPTLDAKLELQRELKATA